MTEQLGGKRKVASNFIMKLFGGRGGGQGIEVSYVLHDGMLVDESTRHLNFSDALEDEYYGYDDGYSTADETSSSVQQAEEHSPEPDQKDSSRAPASRFAFSRRRLSSGCSGVKDPHDVPSLYGQDVSPEEALERIGPTVDGGLMTTVRLLPDGFTQKTRDYDGSTGIIKPRRGTPVVTSSDFFGSLVAVPASDGAGQRWVFVGILNGWPGLDCLEVKKVQSRGPLGGWKTHWDAGKHGTKGIAPTFLPLSTRRPHENSTKGPISASSSPHTKEINNELTPSPQKVNPSRNPKDPSSKHEVRALVQSPNWSATGWSKESPGYLFWCMKYSTPKDKNCQTPKSFQQQLKSRKFSYGSKLLTEITDPEALCTKVHMISHRYAKAKESPKDVLTYHSFVLLEWDHGKYSTVVELAWLNGLGGYKAQSNWYTSPDEDGVLYHLMPPELIRPWKANLPENRCHDIAARNLQELMVFMQAYRGTEPGKRFLDIHHTFSHAVRLTFRSRLHICTYLLNYTNRQRTYSEIRQNCQTFTADFCNFLAGKKDVKPFHPVNRIEYRSRKHYFLYDSHLYNAGKGKDYHNGDSHGNNDY